MIKFSTDYFLFAENVIPGENGKQSIVNIFKEIHIPAVPGVQSLLSLAVGLEFSGSKPKLGSTLRIVMNVKDPAGKSIGTSLITELQITDKEKDGITFGIGANGMPLNVYGDYTFEILINDNVAASKTLKVIPQTETNA